MADALNNCLIAFEDALLAAIQVGAAAFKTVKSYAGEFEVEEGRMRIQAEQLPAVCAMLVAQRFDRRSGERVRRTEWLLLVAARNLRSQAEAVKGGAAGEPGLYDLLEQLVAAVDGGQFPDVSAVPALVTDVDGLLISSDVALYQVSLSAELSESEAQSEPQSQ